VRNLENHATSHGFKLEFDIPFEELYFYGTPLKSVVKIRPTKNCLIAISEFPFFVVDVNEIETVHFERVTYGLKNFDMAIIFKDFQTFKRINSVPIEHIEEIKSYLDEIGIIYSEGALSLNWTTVLQHIREDFQGFIDDGGWKFLQDDDEDDQEEGEEGDDPDSEFSVEEGEGEEDDSESDYSDEDDSGGSSSSEGEELSEEGMSWDDLEKQAEEDDRRIGSKRMAKEAPPAQKKKSRK